jgi:hypothetical protein
VGASTPVAARGWRERLAWLTAAAFALIGIAFAVGFVLRTPKPPQPMQAVRLIAEIGLDASLYTNQGPSAQIGDSLRKLDAGESRATGRDDEAFGSDSGCSHIPGDAAPASQYGNPLDGVDPDLLRAAAKKVSDLMAGFRADLESSAGLGAGTESTTTEATGYQSIDDSYFPAAKLGQLY